MPRKRQRKAEADAQEKTTEAEVKRKADEEAKRKAEEEKGKSKHKTRTVIGEDVEYKAAIVRGDNSMKFKRYKEAAEGYNEALTYKPNDAYATTKLAEAQKNLSSDEAATVKKE